MTATTIDQVITGLTAVIDTARTGRSRLGYFAGLYRLVTIQVKQGIANGQFQDGPRMEQLDVVFANRYLQAYQDFSQQKAVSLCWDVSFKCASAWRPIILQHLLAGMNAHIGFDLGIAAATVAPGAAIHALKDDFNKINSILGSLIGKVQSQIGSVSPWISLLDKIGGRTEDDVIKFSMDLARQSAWLFAVKLAGTEQSAWEPELVRKDKEVAGLGNQILHPGWLLSAGLWVIRARESNDVVKVIDVLAAES